ncbi:ATP-dependent Clp protease adapter protein ClpS [Spirochaetia bacterium]|nr:ATP-dependent Clp protease adapter protein ClpS [Spirochaetia bacterium]
MPWFLENEAAPVAKRKRKLAEPETFRVILLNDHFTTMEFVVEILMFIFRKSEGEANRIMLDIHRQGRGVAGVYPWDIAQTKAEQVHAAARQNEFPLRCVVEKN